MIDKLKITVVYLIFYRYYDDSIKGLTRFNRDTGASRVYHLTLDTPIQSKGVILKVSENKKQFVQLIFNDQVANAVFIFLHKLTVTGEDPVPLQILNGHISRCESLRTTQEEADTIIIHHLVASAPTKQLLLLMTPIFLYYCRNLLSLVTLNYRYICSQPTKNHRHM